MRDKTADHPITTTAISLATDAGLADLLPRNRTRLLALTPLAGAALAGVQRWFATDEGVPLAPTSSR